MATPLANAIVYCRVSTDEQSRGYSLPTQEESCRHYCAERGYTVLDAFHDAHSGTELDRPGLNATIEAVAVLQPAVVVLHDVDRLARDEFVHVFAERELTRHGARVEYVLGGNTDSGDGLLLKDVKQALSAYENWQRVERIRRGKRGRVQVGGVMVGGRPPFGYRYVKGYKTGSLEPDPEEAPIVRRIFAMCADEGLTTYEIAQRLCDARAPNSVRSVLRGEAAKGLWHYGKTRMVKRGERVESEPRPREEWLSLTVPALVDAATWQRAQAQLDRNKANAKRNAKREYLLRGLIYCPSCGRRWSGHSTGANAPAYYRCPTTPSQAWQRDCATHFGIAQTRLESAVLAAVKAFLLDPASRAAGIAAEQERLTSERERLTADLAALDRYLSAVDVKLERLLDQAIAGEFPAEMIGSRKRDMLAVREQRLREREHALARLATADVPDIEAAISALAPTVERAFAQATPTELRRLLDVLRVEVHVVDRDTIRFTGVVSGDGGSIVEITS